MFSSFQEIFVGYLCVCVWQGERMLRCFSRVWLFATPWTVARQAPLSMGFSWQEHWSGLPCPPPRMQLYSVKNKFLKNCHLPIWSDCLFLPSLLAFWVQGPVGKPTKHLFNSFWASTSGEVLFPSQTGHWLNQREKSSAKTILRL